MPRACSVNYPFTGCTLEEPLFYWQFHQSGSSWHWFISKTNCSVLFCIALQCNVLHFTKLNGTALDCTSLHCTALHCTNLQCTALKCTVLHYSAQTCSALWCTARHCEPLLAQSATDFGSSTTRLQSIGLWVGSWWRLEIQIVKWKGITYKIKIQTSEKS